MLIYCNGDSYTAGNELADDLFPNWPGYSKAFPLKTDTNFLKIKEKYLEKFVDYDELISNSYIENIKFHDFASKPSFVKLYGNIEIIERSRAWPAWLERLDNSIKTINQAKGGAGIAGICQRTILDLIELKSKKKSVDLVILQLTSLSRYEIYDETHSDFMYETPIEIGSNLPNKDRKIFQLLLEKYNDFNFLIKYLYNLCLIVESINSITGKYPILIDSVNSEHIFASIENFREHLLNTGNQYSIDRFESLVNASFIEYTYKSLMEKISKDLDYRYCVLGHFSVDAQKLFAKEIYKIIRGEKQ